MPITTTSGRGFALMRSVRPVRYVPEAAPSQGGGGGLAYLPALTTPAASYNAVYSAERLIEAYVGPMVQATRVVDSVSVDLGVGATGIVAADITAIANGTANVRATKAYDQSGGARDAVKTGSSTPSLSDQIVWGGRLPFVFNGASSATPMFYDFVHALARDNFTLFQVMDPNISIQAQAYGGYTDAGKTVDHLALQTSTGGFAGRLAALPGPVDSSLRLYANPQVIVVRNDATELAFFKDGGAKQSKTALAAQAMATGIWGASYTASQASRPTWRSLAYVAVAGALNDADIAAVTAALQSRFSISNTFSNNLIVVGDSIQQGTGSSLTRNLWFYARASLAQSYKLHNLGIGGKKMSAMYADRATYDAACYASGKNNIVYIAAGINDLYLSGPITGAALYTIATNYVTYHKGLGAKVVLSTILPKTDADPNVNIERENYNTLVRANTAGADAIADVAADATMGPYPSAPTDTTLYPDALHPSSLGYSILAPIAAAAVNSQMVV